MKVFTISQNRENREKFVPDLMCPSALYRFLITWPIFTKLGIGIMPLEDTPTSCL